MSTSGMARFILITRKRHLFRMRLGSGIMHTFISYHRKTQHEFADRLAKALLDRDHPVWIDKQGILPAEPWGPAIQTAIIDAEHFLVILNADWLRSDVCREELDFAIQHGKKLITVVAPEFDEYSYKLRVEKDDELGELLPPALKSQNYIWSRESDLGDVVESILMAVVIDFEWNRFATRVQRRAAAWEASNKRHGLLRGDELIEARQAFDDAEGKEPEPTRLALAFLDASESDRGIDSALAAARSDWNQGRVGRAIDTTLRAWELTERSGQPATHAHVLMGHRVIAVFGGAYLKAVESSVGALDPGGKWVALGGGDLRLWQTEQFRDVWAGAEADDWPDPSVTVKSAELQDIDRIAIQGDLLAAVNATKIGVHRLGKLDYEKVLESDVGATAALRFSSDGQWLLANGERGSALWSLTREECTPLWRSSRAESDFTFELGDGVLVRHVNEPRARIEWALLDPYSTPVFEHVQVLAEAAQQIAVAPEGDRWAALCGYHVYMGFIDDRPEPKRVIDLYETLPLDNRPLPIDGLSFRSNLERSPSSVRIRAFGFVVPTLVAIVVSVQGGGFFVLQAGWGRVACCFAGFSKSLATARIDGKEWVVVDSNGELHYGRASLWEPPAAEATFSEDAKLATSWNTKALIEEDGTMWFFRGEDEVVRRRSPLTESTLQISDDGDFIFQHSPTAVALWDASELNAQSIPRVVADTGILASALGTSRDSEIAVGTGYTIISDLGGPSEHSFSSSELMQSIAKAEVSGRWIGIDSGGSIQAWGGGLPEVSVQSNAFMDLPVKLAVSDRGNWAVFHSNRNATFFVDLDARTSLELREDPAREMRAPILKGGLGGSSFLTGDTGGSAHVWLASTDGPERLGRIPVEAGLLDAEARGVDRYVTVHADRQLYTWEIDQKGELPGLELREVSPVRIERNASIEAARFSENGEWLAFQEKTPRGSMRLYLVPTGGAHVITSVQLADQAELIAVDDFGTWVLGREDTGLWLYPSSPGGSHVAPLWVSDSMYGGFAKFLPNRGLIVGTNNGEVKLWPLHGPDLSQRLATLRAVLPEHNDGE